MNSPSRFRSAAKKDLMATKMAHVPINFALYLAGTTAPTKPRHDGIRVQLFVDNFPVAVTPSAQAQAACGQNRLGPHLSCPLI